IFFRYTFVHVAPEDLTPPYWINMGAMAISALVMDAAEIAVVFWIAATVLWFVTFYGVIAVLTIKPDKPSLADGLNGSNTSCVPNTAVAAAVVKKPTARLWFWMSAANSLE